ncbi:hypothetical protein [Sporosarcina sp. G11-34]|uniref:hypothetical protein n=1 Tax=Sporosarcina sp. G11-34 TaxID=2849605 RepID=UPI0022A8D852|nr:hypothetical protein [Sporosarcina sp. G11-34]MCZ2257849.1 hypothetical protein [Sporosarcina sp. G11-34]
MERHYGKFGAITGLLTFILMGVGVRNVLGETLELMNIIAFAIFGLIIGTANAALLFYKLRIAFPIFLVAVVLGFFEFFRSFLTNINGQGDLIGILSLFMITSFGLGLALFTEFVVYLVRKNKESQA